MTGRARLVASLPQGPRVPLVDTPARRPGSLRRTTSVERGWDHQSPEGVTLVGRGRDLRTRSDGVAEVADEVEVRLGVGADATITSVASTPTVDGLAGLVGAPDRSGFRAAVDAALPVAGRSGSLLRQVLDDAPLAALIASYGMIREHDGWVLPPEAADGLTDLCAGWEHGGTMVGTLRETGVFPIPVGPPAPPLGEDGAGDPDAWHRMGRAAPRTVRRVRRIDVAPADPRCLAVEAYFRDAHIGAEGTGDVLHEYTLTAVVRRADMVVLSADAVAHTLPWPECPGALASAGRVVGMAVTGVRSRVLQELTGTSTCTHLNDVIRSLAGVPSLAAALD